MVTLGKEVKDKVTGFKGIAVARCEYLNGCVRIEVQPLELKDGIPQECIWIDETQLESKEKESKDKDSGGPGDVPIMNNPPGF